MQNASDLAFVFLNVQRDRAGKDLILLTENAAMVYETAPKITPAGIIHGTLAKNGPISDIKPIEPKFYDLQIHENVYQILR